jgi:hypothetical protein
MDSCTIRNSGGVSLRGERTTARNCLIVDNYGKSRELDGADVSIMIQAGSELEPITVEHCTVVNDPRLNVDYGVYLCSEKSVLRNTVVMGSLYDIAAAPGCETPTIENNAYVALGTRPHSLKNISYNLDLARWAASGTQRLSARFADAGTGDFSLAESSPLIDAGGAAGFDNLADIRGSVRTQGLAADIGAYEFVSWPAVMSVSPIGRGVSVGTKRLVLAFSKPVDLTDANVSVSPDDGITLEAVKDGLISNFGKTLTLDMSGLEYSRVYTIYIDGVADAYGHKMKTAVHSSFMTAER